MSSSGDVLGTIKTNTQKCGACGSANLRENCSSQYGGEWVYAGSTGCGACKYNCVNFGALGTSCTVASYPTCKKVKYLGDPGKCCVDGSSGSTRSTCDPKYINNRTASDACDGYWQDYCPVSNLEDSKCTGWVTNNIDKYSVQTKVIQKCSGYNAFGTWCQQFKDLTTTAPGIQPSGNKIMYNEIMRKACTVDNMGKKVCQDWCRSSPGSCDSAATTYCADKLATGFCACINSPTTKSKYNVNPSCYDRKCIDSGYRTLTMHQKACPSFTDCSVVIDMVAGGDMDIGDLVIDQNCGNIIDAGGIMSDLSSTKQYLVYGLLLFVFIVIVALGVAIFSGSTSINEEEVDAELNKSNYKDI